MIPRATPILFVMDKSSLNINKPARTIRITFIIMKTEPALLKVSYLSEIAQKIEPIKYNIAPITRVVDLEPRLHFLKNISPMTSRRIAVMRIIKKRYFGFNIRVLLSQI